MERIEYHKVLARFIRSIQLKRGEKLNENINNMEKFDPN